MVLVTSLSLGSFSVLLPRGEGEGRDGERWGLRGGAEVQGGVSVPGTGRTGVQMLNFTCSVARASVPLLWKSRTPFLRVYSMGCSEIYVCSC